MTFMIWSKTPRYCPDSIMVVFTHNRDPRPEDLCHMHILSGRWQPFTCLLEVAIPALELLSVRAPTLSPAYALGKEAFRV